MAHEMTKSTRLAISSGSLWRARRFRSYPRQTNSDSEVDLVQARAGTTEINNSGMWKASVSHSERRAGKHRANSGAGKMGQSFQSGDQVSIDAGDYSGKLGVIVPRRSITYTHSRKGSIPQIEGATGPLHINDMLVRLDTGKIVAIPKDQLSKKSGGEYPLVVRVA